MFSNVFLIILYLYIFHYDNYFYLQQKRGEENLKSY